jgi:hypothetical protein
LAQGKLETPIATRVRAVEGQKIGVFIEAVST